MPPLQRDPPILQELCILLVNDQYGELASKVFSVLCRTGRSTLAALARASYLTGKQIKHGLVTLIQQHLIFHYAADPRVTFYEIDWQQAYSLLRYGRMASMIEHRYGKKASNILLNLVTFGHASVADLNNAYFPPPDTDSDNESEDGEANGSTLPKAAAYVANHSLHSLTNGDGPMTNSGSKTNGAKKENTFLPNNNVANSSVNNKAKRVSDTNASHDHEMADAEEDENNIRTIAELHELIHLLMLNGWIVRVNAAHYLSPGDTHEIARQEILEEEYHGNMPTGTKDKDNLVGQVARRKRRIRDEALAAPHCQSRKRKREDRELDRSSKRLKTMGVDQWTPRNHPGPQDDETLVVRVNMEKLSVAMRTEHLVRLVEKRLSKVTAKIYEAMLWTLEYNQPRCYEPWPDPYVRPDPAAATYVDPSLLITAKDIVKILSRHLDLCEGLDPEAVLEVVPGHRIEEKGNIAPPIKPFDIPFKQRLQLIEKHIWQLSFDPFNFVTWHSSLNGKCTEWHIEYDKIAKTMIQREVDNTIGTRADKLGVKLVRALKKKGRLDEMEMGEAMMMNPNDIRAIVSDLAMKGFVQTQEIPKVDRRESKLSWHLAWFDLQRTREKLLHDTYKGMVRLMQRLAFEKEQVKELLAKAERSDVVGNEDKYLSPGEREALKRFQGVEEALWVQLGREDELVAILRDFVGPFVSV
ncbi:uncharacterized protein BDR25DRAFT_271643 [Lindgomyces ingoldianus]|uniref:Uncharacterized protein n=1 Tax=Lindgomyces ingoldianus TaxID=673940 RepID=A0ACB6QCN8_9PLEO|nr:uncharacterized protein BDR25DRAFT_271643 [Lindgomyces ingoldianus]KAF2464625.1 hypothetical protein BDR25DRAFT_271643 [Lindgomyces ingoldianus]